MSAENLLHKLFRDTTLDDEEQAAELFSELSQHSSLAQQFDVLAIASRQLEDITHRGDTSQMEQHFHELHFMHALDAQLAEESARPPGRVIAVDFSRAQLTVRIVALAAIMLATLGLGIVLRPAEPVDTFQPRGARAVVVGPAPMVSVFCMTRDERGELNVQGEEDAAFGVVACPVNAEIQFAYTNPNESHRYAALFGVSERGETLWYGPSPALPGARRVHRTSTPRALGDSIRLEVNHRPGTMKVYAIFSDVPIDYVKLMSLVKRQPASRHRMLSASHFSEDATLVEKTFDVIEVPR